MREHDSLLAEVRKNLHDDLLRLVYADWLEENGDSDRSTYLRLQVELAREWWYDKPCPELFTRIAAVSARLDPAWLAAVRRCTTPRAPVDVEHILPALHGKAKTAVRLHPRPGEAPVDASKIGGMFLWPKKEPWPVCPSHNQIQYTPVLQLRKEDVPEVGFPPGTDIFQLLWCPERHDEDQMYCPKPAAFWRKRSAVKHPRTDEPNRQADYGYYPQPCVLYPERIIEFPDPSEFDPIGDAYCYPERHPELLTSLLAIQTIAVPGSLHHPHDISEFYQVWLSVTEGTKVGGYPDWVHDPAYPRCTCGAEMEHLLMFGSWEWSGNSWGRWVPIEDRPILSLDFRGQASVHSAHGCMFGDAGQMYVFVCCRHPEPRIRAWMQGS